MSDKNEHAKPEYEQSDINLKPVLLGAAVLAAFVVVLCLGLKPLFRYRKSLHEVSNSVARPTDPMYFVEDKFSKPLLQPEPKKDLKTFRLEEQAWLTSYGWADKEHGLAKVPVDEAIALLLKRGLPTRSEGRAGGVDTP